MTAPLSKVIYASDEDITASSNKDSTRSAMQGDRAKAKAAHRDFLALWKDADPDIPISKQVKESKQSMQSCKTRKWSQDFHEPRCKVPRHY